jgi:phosphatidylserine/phosphatidylglycerophosphate/cardiolipin synthase-like enzyme
MRNTVPEFECDNNRTIAYQKDVVPEHHPALQLVQTTPTGTEGLDLPEISETFSVWVEMILSATKTLDIEQFYIIDKQESDPGDGPGRLAPVLDAIKSAAARGVVVRIVIDSKYAKEYERDWNQLSKIDGIEVRQIAFEDLTGGILHAKYFIVDGCEAFIGSQNFDWRSLEHVVELGVRIRVPNVVQAISGVFETDWAIAGGERDFRARIPDDGYGLPVNALHLGKDIQINVAFSPAGWLPDESLWDLPQIINMIDNAKDRLRLQVMSYAITDYKTPEFWEAIDNAVRRAATRNVDVRILIGDWTKHNDLKMASVRSLHCFPNIVVRMVTIPPAVEGEIPFARVIHSKFLTIDDQMSWIGTSNWSRDYFYNSRNLGLIVRGPSFAAQLNKLFDKLWSSIYSYEVMAGPLRDVLNRVQICRNAGHTPIVIFDLDDTLFSTRERTLRIMQEFSKDYSDQFSDFQHVLNRISLDDVGYGIIPTLQNIGVSNSALAKELQAYWWARFFQDEYVAYDLPVPGVVNFVNECFDNGAVIYYCTGRHYRKAGRRYSGGNTRSYMLEKESPSTGMERGTIRALLDRGFPLASGRAILHLKSSFHQHDADFKNEDAIPKIRALNGQVVATFENEPENANIFLRAFPEAMHFWLQTQHKPDAKPADPHLIKIYDFFTRMAPA